jgi:hypothetical protein
MVMVVTEIDGMEAEVVVAEREVFDSASAVEVVVTCRESGVV